MKCPKCKGEMEEGTFADRTGDLSLKMPFEWGKKINPPWGLEDAKKIIAYRCKECGFLENYAK